MSNEIENMRNKQCGLAVLIAMDKAVATGQKQHLGLFRGVDVWVIAGTDLEHPRRKGGEGDDAKRLTDTAG